MNSVSTLQNTSVASLTVRGEIRPEWRPALSTEALEFVATEAVHAAVHHQRVIGTGYFEAVSQAIIN